MGQDWGQLGENAAQALRPEGHCGGRGAARGVGRLLRRLRRARDRAQAWSAGRQRLPPAVEWLLDNWYLAQREGEEAGRALRRAGRLRCVRRDGRREPLVLELARVLAAGAGDLDATAFRDFLARAQAVRPLTERELSLLVPALKRALAERLAALCARLEGGGYEDAALAEDFRGSLPRCAPWRASTSAGCWRRPARWSRSCAGTPPASTGRWTTRPGGATGPSSAAWPESGACPRRRRPGGCWS